MCYQLRIRFLPAICSHCMKCNARMTDCTCCIWQHELKRRNMTLIIQGTFTIARQPDTTMCIKSSCACQRTNVQYYTSYLRKLRFMLVPFTCKSCIQMFTFWLQMPHLGCEINFSQAFIFDGSIFITSLHRHRPLLRTYIFRVYCVLSLSALFHGLYYCSCILLTFARPHFSRLPEDQSL